MTTAREAKNKIEKRRCECLIVPYADPGKNSRGGYRLPAATPGRSDRVVRCRHRPPVPPRPRGPPRAGSSRCWHRRQGYPSAGAPGGRRECAQYRHRGRRRLSVKISCSRRTDTGRPGGPSPPGYPGKSLDRAAPPPARPRRAAHRPANAPPCTRCPSTPYQ